MRTLFLIALAGFLLVSCANEQTTKEMKAQTKQTRP